MNGILNIISVYSVAYLEYIPIILAVYAGPSQLFQESDAMSQSYAYVGSRRYPLLRLRRSLRLCAPISRYPKRYEDMLKAIRYKKIKNKKQSIIPRGM